LLLTSDLPALDLLLYTGFIEIMRPAYTEIYRPNDQLEVMMLKMVLEREGVNYFITNEHLNSILPLAGLGDMRLMVETSRAQQCVEILRDELHYLQELK
jgi:hypothetical protein